MTTTKVVHVSASFVWRIHNDRPEILLFKRPRGGNEVLAWENPGGKIEDGEEPKEALLRELREEVGIENDIIGEISAFYGHDAAYPGMVCHVNTFLTRVAFDFIPKLSNEHLGMCWFGVEELDGLLMLSGMEPLMPLIKTFLSGVLDV